MFLLRFGMPIGQIRVWNGYKGYFIIVGTHDAWTQIKKLNGNPITSFYSEYFILENSYEVSGSHEDWTN